MKTLRRAKPILGNASIRAEILMLEATVKEIAGDLRYGAEKMERVQRKLAELREQLPAKIRELELRVQARTLGPGKRVLPPED